MSLQQTHASTKQLLGQFGCYMWRARRGKFEPQFLKQFLASFPFFEGRIKRLMRSSCCLCVCVSHLPTSECRNQSSWNFVCTYLSPIWMVFFIYPCHHCVFIRFLTGATAVLFPRLPDWLWGAPRALYPGVNRPGREANHSPSSSVEVNKSGAIVPLPHTSLLRCA
jgi:hypothetical protein